MDHKGNVPLPPVSPPQGINYAKYREAGLASWRACYNQCIDSQIVFSVRDLMAKFAPIDLLDETCSPAEKLLLDGEKPASANRIA